MHALLWAVLCLLLPDLAHAVVTVDSRKGKRRRRLGRWAVGGKTSEFF